MIKIVDGDFPSEYIQAALHARIVGVDIETDGLWPHLGHRIACVQMYVPEVGTIMARRLLDIPRNLINLMESRRVTKVFQHAPFDISFLLNEYPMLKPRALCDTKMAADILDPKREMFTDPAKNKKSHSLIALVWYYFEDLLDKETAVSDWNKPVLTTRQLSYAEKDVIYLPELIRKLERAIIEKDPLLVLPLVRQYNKIQQLAMDRLKQIEEKAA